MIARYQPPATPKNKPLSDVRFTGDNVLSSETITLISGNETYTKDLEAKLRAAGIAHDVSADREHPHASEFTITGEKNLRAFVAAGGDFPGKVHFETHPFKAKY